MVTHNNWNASVVRLVGLIVIVICSLSFGLVGIREHGDWPKAWPKELESYRNQAKTLMVGTGTQENVFEIYFKEREDFEKIWPILLVIKSDGAPLKLRSIESASKTQIGLFSNKEPMVRIYCPAYDSSGTTVKNKKLCPYPPWSESVYLPNGKLPEYVRASEEGNTWLPVWSDPNSQKFRGFLFRARIDIELVVDGNIIDLNRIKLPPFTYIIDNRKLNGRTGNSAQP
jgi:hypothetical protein